MEEADIIIQEWGLDASGLHSKESILAALTAKIDAMFTGDPVALIQVMYRLDIPEAQLDAALDSEHASQWIAQLVWDRQVMKSVLRRSTPPRPTGDEDLYL